jgi:hypothetical protein
MNGKAPASGLKGYLGALVATLLFPLAWVRSMALARRHVDVDPRGPAKVAAAIVVGVVLVAGGIFVLFGFQDNAKAGMYDSMETRVAAAVGETTYQDNVATIDAADNAIPVIERNLVNATAAAERMAQDGSTTAAEQEKANKTRDDLATALKKTRDQRTHSERNVTTFAPNHALFLRLQPLIEDQDDSAIRAEVARTGLDTPAGMQEGTAAALAIKDEAVSDMHLSLWLFVWPSLAGMFFAPLAFALGSILRNTFVESDSVGFKPYPGGAAGWFLLFGAFGLPSIPFAAWVFMDAENRSVEGQIAL